MNCPGSFYNYREAETQTYVNVRQLRYSRVETLSEGASRFWNAIQQKSGGILPLYPILCFTHTSYIFAQGAVVSPLRSLDKFTYAARVQSMRLSLIIASRRRRD